MLLGSHAADAGLRGLRFALGPFFCVTAKNAEKCLQRLPDSLKHERVVAMGEGRRLHTSHPATDAG